MGCNGEKRVLETYEKIDHDLIGTWQFQNMKSDGVDLSKLNRLNKSYLKSKLGVLELKITSDSTYRYMHIVKEVDYDPIRSTYYQDTIIENGQIYFQKDSLLIFLPDPINRKGKNWEGASKTSNLNNTYYTKHNFGGWKRSIKYEKESNKLILFNTTILAYYHGNVSDKYKRRIKTNLIFELE